MTPTQQYTKETGLDPWRLPSDPITSYKKEYIEWLEMKLRGERVDIDTMVRTGTNQTMKGDFGMRSFIYCKQKHISGQTMEEIGLKLKVSSSAVKYKIGRFDFLIENDKYFQKVAENYKESVFLKELEQFNRVRYPRKRL